MADSAPTDTLRQLQCLQALLAGTPPAAAPHAVGAHLDAQLAPLTAAQHDELRAALARVRHLLGDASSRPPVTLREPAPGDLGWIIHRHAALYAREYGLDWHFEALVAEIAGRFVREFSPTHERCWVAEWEGTIVGSVFVVRQDEHTAKLRLLYVEPTARGQGLGRRLVDECLAFAKACGYRRMVLWTNDVLHAARHIYVATGFELIEEEAHRSFGQDLVGQTWARDL